MEQKLMKVYEKELKDEAKKQKEVTYLHVLSQCQFLLLGRVVRKLVNVNPGLNVN